MKKTWLWLLIMLLLLAVGSLGREIEPEEAYAVASSFLQTPPSSGNRPLSVGDQIESVIPLHDADGELILGYVYQLSPKGYVVVSADTELPPVIAYSLESDFAWEQSSVLLNLLQTDLALRMEALQQELVAPETRTRNAISWEAMSSAKTNEQSSGNDVVIGPLLEAPTWGQTAPWSDFLPTDPITGDRSSVGCAATALAQILNYYRYPSSVSFSSSDSYVSLTKQISIDATDASLPEIEYASKSHHNPSDNTMARLSLAAGVSVKMDYTSAGSGAYAIDIAVALAGGQVPITSSRGVRPAIWRYESAEIRTSVNSHWGAPFYQSANEFYGDLKEDLADGRPVILFVKTAGALTGHILICDGYETSSGRYHLNLGWSGRSDGWYALPEDMPPGYNVVEYGILEIRPPATSSTGPDRERGRDTSTVTASTEVTEVLAYPNPFASEVSFNYTGGLTGVTMSVSVYDLSGRPVWSDEVSGEPELTWDGRDEYGDRLANGPYLYLAVVTDGTNTSVTKGKLFILR